MSKEINKGKQHSGQKNRIAGKNRSIIPVKKKKKYTILVLPVLISLITFLSFYPSLHDGFTNWDDNVYITENSFVNDLKTDNLKQIFNTPVSLNYHPLTMLSLAFDYKLAFNDKSGILSPVPFHRTNVIIHILNTILVFYLIFLLSGENIIIASIVSLFFGIHPLRVESVTWISERKDVLYCFFYILSLIFYLRYLSSRRTMTYFLVLLSFICSLLSKGMAMTLPFILILLDYYRSRKITKAMILEKIPFFILSILFGIIALKIQSNGALGEFGAFNIFQRFLIASYGLCIYVYKLFLPVNLCSFYPYPFPFVKELVKFPFIFYLCPFIVIVTAFLIFYSKKYTRVFIFGFLFYFFSIVIVLQFVSVGTVIIADRYTYIPFIGLFYIIAVLCNKVFENGSSKNRENSVHGNVKYLLAIILAGFAAFCSYTTFNRTKVWKNSKTLWTDVIVKYPQKVETSYLNRGNYYARELSDKDPSYLDSAMADYHILMKMNKANHSVYSTMGNVYAIRGMLDSSIESYNRSILLDSSDYKTYINRALTFIKLKKFDLSLRDIEKVLKMTRERQPYVLEAYNNLMLNNYQKAVFMYTNLINNYVDYYDAYLYRGLGYMKLKQYDKALFDFNFYMKFNNKKPDVYYYVSNIYYDTGKYKEAYDFAMRAKQNGYKTDEKYLLLLEGKFKQKHVH